MGTKKFIKERSLTATAIMMFLIVVVFVVGYLQIGNLIDARCVRRMEEGVDTALDEVLGKLNRDSQILNAAAEILASTDYFDAAAMQDAISSFAPMIETQRIYILLPDNTVIMPDGDRTEGTDDLDFNELARLGEHVSNKTISVADGNTPVLRHYVPIVQNGQTMAILYGVTRLEDLPNVLNIENIYNASASVYIVDMQNSEFIMDTRHEQLGDISEFSVRRTKGPVSWESTVENILSGETGSVLFLSARSGEWEYLYYRPAGINQWSVMISVPRSEAFANLFSIQWVFLVMGIVITLVFVEYYLWSRKNAMRTVAEAVEKARLE